MRRHSGIVDQFGRPVAAYLYPSPSRNPSAYKPRPWLSPKARINISRYDRMELVNLSMQLYAQIDELNAGVEGKNNWAFNDAWDYHYTGKNRAWGEEAENFIRNQWMPNCNIRGPLFDFKSSLSISGKCLDVIGDDVMVLTKSPDGFPMVGFYAGTSIGSAGKNSTRALFDKTNKTNTISGGEFSGADIFDGIIYDRNSRPIGVRIVGEDDTETDVSTYNADLAWEPKWHNQGRGFPSLSTGLLKWMDLQDIDDFIRRGVKRAASVGLISKTEEGEAPIGNEIVTGEDNADPCRNTIDGSPVADRKVAYEEISGGELYYLSSSGNESIEALNFQNPHPNTEAFVERVMRGALASIGWHLELLDLGSTGRAPTRILCDLANQSIWSRQKTLLRRARRAVAYAIGAAMKHGYLSRNSDGHDPYMMDFGLPKPISVDAGNDAAADREALKLGITNKSIVIQKTLGLHYREVDRQRAIELRESIEEAKAISSEHPEITFDRALELLEQRSPNPIAQSPKTKERPAQPAK